MTEPILETPRIDSLPEALSSGDVSDPAQPKRARRLHRTVKAAVGTIVGSAIGAVLPFAVTFLVASSAKTDVFFLVAGAAQLASYLLATVVEGSILPLAMDVAKDNVGDLRVFCRHMTRQAFLLAAPVTCGLLLVILVMLKTVEFSPSQYSAGLGLMAGVVALPTLAALSSLYGAAHYAQDRFAWTTASQGLRAAGGLIGALFAGGSMGVASIAVGLCAGELGRAVLLAATMPAARESQTAWRGKDTASGVFFVSATPLLAATIIVAVNPLVDKAVASHLGVGAVTAIELAEKLFYVPMTLLFSAVTVVSGVVWARLGEDDLENVAADFWRVQRVAILVSTTIALAGSALALAFGAGVASVFRLNSTVPFSAVFALYIMALPFALAQSLAGRLLVVMRRTRMLPYLAVALVILNLVADVVGAALLGVRGIAVSSSIVRVVNAAVFLFFAARMFRQARRA